MEVEITMEEAKKMLSRKNCIRIRGANEHNLKNLDVDIPRDSLVVLTGLSGSGKSSLAFDTIYAEGQRRYMESLSSYARQFLGQMEKPDVEKIEGLSPAISIDQKSTNRNPRSTVGTVTEIYDYFRLLYARIGIPHCPNCGKEIKKQSVDQMVDQIMSLPEGTRIQLLAPVVRGRKGRHEKVLERAARSGYVRVRIDGNLYELSEEIKLDKNIKHNIEQCGNYKKYQRRTAVAKRPEHSGKQIVYNLRKKSGGYYDNIVISLIKETVLGVHYDKKWSHANHCHSSHHHGYDRRQYNGAADCFAHALKVISAELLRGDDCKAYAHTGYQAEKQKRDRSCRADARKSLRAQRITHDYGICHIIKLLKYISYEYRQGKPNN